jgi:hypothetical protein
VAAPRAVAWAGEAGLAPSVEEVRRALDGGSTCVEDQFFKLLAALDLPGLTPTGP